MIQEGLRGATGTIEDGRGVGRLPCGWDQRAPGSENPWKGSEVQLGRDCPTTGCRLQA